MYSADDKLPKSTGDMDSIFLGKLWTVQGNGSSGVSGIPLGNNLVLKTAGE